MPINSWGSVPSMSGTRIRLFLAASTAFLIALGTSFALPVPKPTWPASSPTTTSAANDKFLPPLTTLVTRLIEINWSLRSKPLAEILCFLVAIVRSCLLCLGFVFVKAGLTRRIKQCLDTAMIDITAAVEHDAFDARAQRTLGDRLADGLCSVDIAAGLQAKAFFGCRRSDKRLAAAVVDHLRVDVIKAAIHREPGPLSRTANFLANTAVNSLPNICSAFLCHNSVPELQCCGIAES